MLYTSSIEINFTEGHVGLITQLLCFSVIVEHGCYCNYRFHLYLSNYAVSKLKILTVTTDNSFSRMIGVVILVATLITGAVGAIVNHSEQSVQPLIMEDRGVALVPSSYIVSGSSKIYISVYLYVPLPFANRSAPPSCLPASCDISQAMYRAHLAVADDNPCLLAGKNHRISLLQSIPNSKLFFGNDSCIALCLQRPDCKGVQWIVIGKTCNLRADEPTSDLDTSDRSNIYVEYNISCLDARVNRAVLCGGVDTDNLHTLLTSARDTAVHHIWKKNKQYLLDLEHAYDIIVDKQGDRKRRAAAAALFGIPVIGGLIGGLFGAYNSYEIKKLKRHIQSLGDSFLDFSEQVVEELTGLRRMDNDILLLVKNLQQDTHEELRKINCDINALGMFAIESMVFDEWKAKIDAIFSSVRQGSMSTSLNSALLSLDDIKYLVEKNKIFKNSIFAENPSLLLRSADLTLVKASKEQGGLKFQFVLSTMFIPKANIFS